MKGEKCEFHVELVAFLGYIIERGNLNPDPVKIQAVLEWPESTNCRQLQRFFSCLPIFIAGL